MSEARISAIMGELAMQRALLGDRAANIAADVAELRAENEALRRRVSEFEAAIKSPSQV